MNNLQSITLGSLFDGIGGFPYAASFYGIKSSWASEIIPAAISITRRHFPDMEHIGDITKLNGGEIPPVDIITFGSPCQSFSIAGGRKGLEGKSGLFWEAIRIIREMRKATNGRYPRYSIFENVPGILSANRGRDYKTVLEAFTETEIPFPPSGRWTNAGMVRGGRIDFAWIIHDAQYFGVAQRRRRLFAVCDFTGQRAAEILFKPKSLYWYFTQSGEAREEAAANAPESSGNTSGDCLAPCASFLGGQGAAAGSIAYSEKVSPTLKSGASGSNMVPCVCEPTPKTMKIRAGCEGGGKGALIQDNKSATLSCNNDQTVFVPCEQAPKVYCLCADSSNSMRSDNPDSGIYEADTSRTLDRNGGNPVCNQGGMVVVEQPYAAMGVNQNASGDLRTADTAYSLTTSSNATGRNAPLVCHPDIAAYCLQGSMIGRKDKNGPQGDGVNDDVCFTLSATDRHAVAAVFSRQRSDLFKPDNLASTQTARQSKDATDLICQSAAAVDCRNLRETEELSGTLQAKSSGSYSLNYQNPIRTGYIVRRLTPTECEFLQGYFGGYTEYGHDGKPLSDTARYQALGNSVAIPCVAYVIAGIVDELINAAAHGTEDI